MRDRCPWLRTFVLVVVGAVLVTPSAQARDEDSDGVWVYDVRVVRVDLSTPELAERLGPFADIEGTTTDLGWLDALARLKRRGKITIHLDQRGTTLTNVKLSMQAERSTPGISLSQSDMNNKTFRSSTMKTGCSFEATARGSSSFAYHLKVLWALGEITYSEDPAPPQMVTSWNGTHPALGGRTLVLRYREQVPRPKGAAHHAVEIYGLITQRQIRGD